MQSNDPRLIHALELQGAGRVDDARRAFAALLDEQPDNFICLFSIALIDLNNGQTAAALAMIERGIAANPGFARSYALKGMALQALDRPQEALAAMDEALRRDDRQLDMLLNRGVLLHSMKRPNDALESFDRALAMDPGNTGALNNRGTLLSETSRHQEAADCFARLVEVAPHHDYALGLLAFARRHCCDWRDHQALRTAVEQGLRDGRRTCKSLALMAISDDPALQLSAARLFAEHRYPAPSPAVRWLPPPRQHPRLRIAYVSPDFREHSVAHLTAGIFEAHDRQRFEVIGVSLGIDDGSPLAQRIRAGFDRFVEVQGRTTQTIVEQLRALEIDIAIDLAGYTADARTDVFAQRVAPLQVNWLGYPGTLGTSYHDYLLADRQVIPAHQRSFYTEHVVTLRDAYLPTDSRLEVAERTPTRAECGLPETGFVFCSFNHDYKISPEMFALWMRLLQEVEGSVLWLMRLHQAAQDNLRAAASAHGIDPDRLVFATRVPRVQDHLARYRLADLFLDTYPYNAHTTAADALFVGLPLLTYMGRSFPGRVAGSLLHALGIPELITDSPQRYFDRALELARDPTQLAALRQKIAAHRSSHPLFDTRRFVDSLETAYSRMHGRWQQGLPAQGFAVDDSVIAPPALPATTGREPLRLRIGAQDRQPGWRNVAPELGPNIDFLGSLTNLKRFATGSVDEVYALHELVKLPQALIIPALAELRRVLRPDGRLLLSVPDMSVLARLFLDPQTDKDTRFRLMRMLFGGQTSASEFHLVGLDYDFLADYLAAAGFSRLERVSGFGLFVDASEALVMGHRINLNVVVYP